MDFNSIKVRLEHYYKIYQLRHIKFQFHKGAIRTILASDTFTARNYFNSIKVRLELNVRYYERFLKLNFNSIKVRLELIVVPQFSISHIYFNSIKVRLELALWFTLFKLIY